MSKSNISDDPKYVIFDYETIINCFIGVFYYPNADKTFIFEISERKNDYNKLISFLDYAKKEDVFLTGFNNIKFDSQISQDLLVKHKTLKTETFDKVNEVIYNSAQNAIDKMRNDEFPKFKKTELYNKQLDLMAMNNYDSGPKACSLKWVEFGLDWDNVMDMPIPHDKPIHVDDIDLCIEYCINDVKATYELFKISKREIDLRYTFSQLHGLNLHSSSEPDISKQIFGKILSEKLDIPLYELKKLRTIREKVVTKDLIFPYTKFKTKMFNDVFDVFKKLVVYDGDKFKHEVSYKNMKITYGLGGVHGCTDKGWFKSDDDYIIVSSDVKSYYPNLSIRNKLAPAHLPEEIFLDTYEGWYDERITIPKSNPVNYLLKILLNATYGLTKDKNSFLYDMLMTYGITINGQLSLTMCLEAICETIPEAQPLLFNTDGFEVRIPRAYYDKYMQICKYWEQLTNLVLEHDTYEQLLIGDVNNYIGHFGKSEISKEEFDPEDISQFEKDGVYYKNHLKTTGRFTYEKIPLHKNKSNVVSRIAIVKYMLYRDSVSETIKSHKNIFDFCYGAKIKKGFDLYCRTLNLKTRKVEDEPLQKTNRYFISKSGCRLIKIKSEDQSESQLHVGDNYQTLFNVYEEKENFEEYGILYSYYISSALKELCLIASSPKLELEF